jgi:hypothetical protein
MEGMPITEENSQVFQAPVKSEPPPPIQSRHSLYTSGVWPNDSARSLNKSLAKIKHELRELEQFSKRKLSTSAPDAANNFVITKAEVISTETQLALLVLDSWETPDASVAKKEERLNFYLLLKMFITQAYFHVSSIKKGQNDLISSNYLLPPERASFRLKMLKGRNSVFKDTLAIEENETDFHPQATEAGELRVDHQFLDLVKTYDDLSLETNNRISELKGQLEQIEGTQARKRHAIFCCGKRIVCVGLEAAVGGCGRSSPDDSGHWGWHFLFDLPPLPLS